MNIDNMVFDKSKTEKAPAKKKVPKVSIGMPVYNGESFIRESLNSLLAQTFTDFELIISDNASTDSTEVICLEYAERDTRIKYIRQTENIGPLPNFKFVLDEAVGEYFMWAAADDTRSPDCIETYIKYIGKSGGIFTTYAYFDRKTNTTFKPEVIILPENYKNNKLLRIFFKKLDPSLFYGLFKRELIINLPFYIMDWFDAYFIIRVINDFKFTSIKTVNPKFFKGHYGHYIAKPFFGSYLRPHKYFFRALPYAIKSGGLSIFYHTKTLLRSYIINFHILKKIKKLRFIYLVLLKYILKPLRKLINIYRLVCFKFKYPNVPIIWPSRIGTYYSQEGQDLYLSSLLFDIIQLDKNKDLWIVDVGCNHPLKYSNSFFFEKIFSFRVLAIDAIQEFESIFSVMRPKTNFVASAVGEDSGMIELNIPIDTVFSDNMFSYVKGAFNKKTEMVFKKRIVKLSKLADLIATSEGGIKEILFISIDIEGFELSALKGINFEDVKIYCIICENNSTLKFGSDDIREFLKEKGFRFYSRIGNQDDVFINSLLLKEDGSSSRVKVR